MTAVDIYAEFEAMHREAFRLQQLQSYAGVENEGWVAWRESRPIPPYTPENFEFGRKQVEWTREGKRIYDVHVIEWPLAEYVRYVLEVIPMTAWTEHGSYFVDRDAHPDLATLTEDFWMFDEERVAVMNYDEREAFIGATAPTEPVAVYVARRDLAMRYAVPFDEWIVTNRSRIDR